MKEIEDKNLHKSLGIKFLKSEDGACSLEFSDGEKFDLSAPNIEKLKAVCKNISGSEDSNVLLRLLSMFQGSISGLNIEERMNDLADRMALLDPRSPAEAMLACQFVSLQKAALRCLAQIHGSMAEGNQIEFFINQCAKLTRLSNETMQTLIRLRTAGQQTCTVLHVTNNGQAVVQNVNRPGGGL